MSVKSIFSYKALPCFFSFCISREHQRISGAEGPLVFSGQPLSCLCIIVICYFLLN